MKLAGAILFFLLLTRAATLPLGHLVDPTEARYAAVAQEMYLSDKWLTPMLPGREGLEPYLGKPPLHFWLTAVCYSLLGVSAWTSRLPSFLLALGCLLFTYILSRKLKDSSPEEGLLAVLIALVSPLFFLLAGASTVDLTLAFFVLFAFTAFANWADAKAPLKRNVWAWLCALAIALGVLTKGPVAPVLFVVGIFPWLYFSKRFYLLKQLPLGSMFAVFLLFTIPWFWLSERAHPGFLKYYIWNENVARYLISDYGDRYGTGHVFPRGAVWVMLFVAIFPWGFALVEALLRRNLRASFFSLCKEDAWFLFVLLGGLAPAIFFTLVRQLHTAYVLPGVPLLAIVIARLIVNYARSINSRLVSMQIAPVLLLVLCLGSLLATPWLGTTLPAGMAAAFILLAGLVLAGYFGRFPVGPGLRAAVLLGTLLLMLLPIVSKRVDQRKSTKSIIELALQKIEQTNPQIGIGQTNIYSPFWLAKAWQQELGKPIEVSYVDINNLEHLLPDNILLRKVNSQQMQTLKNRGYAEQQKSGSWSWFAKMQD